MHVSEGFASFLVPRLAKGNRLRVHHISTRPAPCPPLFAPGPGQSTEKTWCECHFLACSQKPVADPGNGSSLLVLGLEVLIFTTENLTTIFVSKADSTGYLLRQPVSSAASSVAFATTSAFLEFLVLPRLAGSRVVLSLFARSQNQYLFPGSIENDSKRILDDRQLIKWWCRVLDPIVRAKPLVTDSEPASHTKAYVVVPSCETAETKAFFPPSARHDRPDDPKWVNQYPAAFLNQDGSLPARCLVPRLPDDPKARFLDDLDGMQVNDDGSWKGVKSLDQFWEMMSYRQECSAGRLVGFIWVTFSPPKPVVPILSAVNGTQSDKRPASVLPTESPSALEHLAKTSASAPAAADSTTAPRDTQNLEERPTEQGIPTAADDSDTQIPLSWPASSRGELILSNEQYSTIMDYLLQLDFAGEELANKSTNDWIDRAKTAAGANLFGIDIAGTYVPVEVTRAEAPAAPVANILTAVRKKRKAESTPPVSSVGDAPVNQIELDAVRKKPRA